MKFFADYAADCPGQANHSYESLISQRRKYVEQKLIDAKSKDDDLRQGIGLRALANIDQDEEQFGAALNRYGEAVALDPKDSSSLASRGETYRLMGRYDEALADFNRAIEIDPSRAWAIASRGVTYRLMGRHDEALADFNRAIEIDPSRAWAITRRGETYRLMGRHDEALADFNRAIEIDPSRAWAIARRGETYRLMGRYDEALADLKRATELDPGSDWYFYRTGLVLYLLDNTQSAKVALAQAVELSEASKHKYSRAWRDRLNLAVYHVASGNRKRGRILIEQAIKAHAPKRLLSGCLLDLKELNDIMPLLVGSRELIDLLEKHEGSLS